MVPRIIKQLIIGLIFVVIAGGIFYWFYSKNALVATCFDNIRNGLEEGVDCGVSSCGKPCIPVLADIEVQSSQLLNAGPGYYDFVAKLSNPNREYGSFESAYELVLLDKNNQEVTRQEGTFYILPGQQKYLVVNAINSSGQIVDAQFKIKSAQWARLDSLDGMNFSVKNKTYDILRGGSSSELKAILTNNSDYDFGKIDMVAILLNDGGKILAVARTDVRTLLAHTERAIDVVWPFPVQGKVATIEVEPSTNLYDNLNYIKRYGSPTEQFQKYY